MSGTDARLNVGVVGTGFVATTVHIPFLKELPMADVIAVADSAPGRAEAVASQYGIPSYTADYRRLLDSKDIDVVDICTPAPTHARIVVDAIGAGKDVIVEKPLAMSLAECAAMQEAVGRSPGAHLGVVLNLRYMPLVHSVVQAVHGGQMGEIARVSAVIHTAPPAAGWHADPTLSRYGELYDYLPHVLDLVLWGLQAHPTAVRCVASSRGGNAHYLIVEMWSPIAGECSALLDVAWTSATSIRSVQFWGSEQDLFLDLQDQFWYFARGHLTPLKRGEEFARRATALAKRAAGGRMSIKYGGMMYHRDLLRDFLTAFGTGRCPWVSLAEGLLHVAVIDAAVRSLQEDRVVSVPFPPLMPT